ncbi:glycosyltransferase family 2 protein [Amedibacillus sp. YH-ame10]
MPENKYVTIFTPTYNRKDKLSVLFNSLCRQTSKDFEWVIVDDGSIDETESFIKELQSDEFPILFFKKENGGKHTAINYGVKEAKGKVFAIVDSDDYLVPKAVETIIKWFKEIENINNFAGVAAQKAFENSNVVGTFYDKDYVDALSTERDKLHIDGDKFEVFYTDVLRQFPFPVIEKETFMTEAVVWNRIASAGLKLRWHKESLYVCEYLENGLTDQKDRLVKHSPKGYALFIREIAKTDISLKRLLGFYSYYYGIRKDQCSFKEVAKELECSVFILYVSNILRKLLYMMRR